jgi:hypothetical protein
MTEQEDGIFVGLTVHCSSMIPTNELKMQKEPGL